MKNNQCDGMNLCPFCLQYLKTLETLFNIVHIHGIDYPRDIYAFYKHTKIGGLIIK